MKKTAIGLLAILYCFTISAQEVAQWRGNNRDGAYNETNLLKSWAESGPQLLWHFDGLGLGYSSAAVTSKKVYSSGMIGEDGFVFAIDHNGKLLWKSKYGAEFTDSYAGARSTPLVIDDKLYMMSGMGNLFCMNANDGSILWQVDLIARYGARNIRWGMTENLAYMGNMLFCTPGGVEHNVIALDRNTGNLIWTSKAKGEESAYCSPVVASHKGRNLLITQMTNSIIGLDVNTGKFLWSHPQPNQWSVQANAPFYSDGMVLSVSGYGQGSVMLKISDDGNSIKEMWRNESLDGRMGGFVVIGNKIYGASDKGVKWICLDWNTGKELIAENLIKKGNIISADGMLFMYGEDGKVVMTQPTETSYNIIGTFEVPYGEEQHWAHLVIHDKKLYVRHGTSLMVYSLAAK